MRVSLCLWLAIVCAGSARAAGPFETCDSIRRDGEAPPIDMAYTSSSGDTAVLLPPNPFPALERLYDLKVFSHYVLASTAQGVVVLDVSGGTPPRTLEHTEAQSCWGLWVETIGDQARVSIITTVAGHSKLHVVQIDAGARAVDDAWVEIDQAAPTNGPDGDVMPCRVAATDATSDHSAGAIGIAGAPGFVFTTNECLTHGVGPDLAGSVDVIDVRTKVTGVGPHIVQRMRVDRAPAGIVVGDNQSRLFVTAERAGKVALKMAGADGTPVGSDVGALYVFQLDTSDTTGHVVRKMTAANAGCIPARVAVASEKQWVLVSARESNEVRIYDGPKLKPATVATALLARVATGPQPTPVEVFADGTALVVSNSFRTNDVNAFAETPYPRPSTMVFRVADIDMTNSSVRQTPNMCRNYPTPTPGGIVPMTVDGVLKRGYAPSPDGDFPRNFASDATNLYIAMNGAGRVQVRPLADIRAAVSRACVALATPTPPSIH